MTRFQRPISASTKAHQLYPDAFWPTHAAMFCNHLQMPVMRRGLRLGRRAWHRVRPRWHDDRGIGMADRDLAVDAVLVVCAIAGERSDGIVNLVQQGSDLRAVIEIIGGQRRRGDSARIGIDTDVPFAPRPAPARTVLLDQPLASTAQFQPSAVHQQMHGFGAGRGARHRQPLGPPTQSGMVRDGEVEAKQMDDGADQPFGLPQRQPEHCPQGQRRRNRHGRIARLTTPCRAWLGPPRRDRFFAEPHHTVRLPRWRKAASYSGQLVT